MVFTLFGAEKFSMSLIVFNVLYPEILQRARQTYELKLHLQCMVNFFISDGCRAASRCGYNCGGAGSGLGYHMNSAQCNESQLKDGQYKDWITWVVCFDYCVNLLFVPLAFY